MVPRTDLLAVKQFPFQSQRFVKGGEAVHLALGINPTHSSSCELRPCNYHHGGQVDIRVLEHILLH
eukprot:9470103-Pyramimonas_sp.AAC.2